MILALWMKVLLASCRTTDWITLKLHHLGAWNFVSSVIIFLSTNLVLLFWLSQSQIVLWFCDVVICAQIWSGQMREIFSPHRCSHLSWKFLLGFGEVAHRGLDIFIHAKVWWSWSSLHQFTKCGKESMLQFWFRLSNICLCCCNVDIGAIIGEIQIGMLPIWDTASSCKLLVWIGRWSNFDCLGISQSCKTYWQILL